MKLQYRIVMKRIAAALLVTVLCMTGVPFTHVAANQLPQEGMQPADEQALYGYEDYCAGISEQSFLQSPINITCDNITATDNGMLDIQEFDNKAAVVIGKDTEWCEWTFEVPDDGIYNISLEYFPLEGTGLNITAGLYLDNEIPFAELRTFDLPRIWKDKTEIKQDEQGNDLRPTQIEKVRWIDTKLCDTSGKFENPYLFYSKAGSHTLKLRVTRESMAIACIRLSAPEEILSYEEYIAQYGESDKVSNITYRFEAENSFEKNSAMLYALTDKSSIATQPNDPFISRLNVIGQENWDTPGQFITWKVTVPQNGLYTLAFRARQNMNQGMHSYRTLSINGEVPFKEAENIEFKYNSDWYIKVLGDEAPFQVYLKSGDEITLTCSSGKLCEVFRQIQKSVLNLNEVYRKIIFVTGVSPDVYRDYSLETEIPDLSDRLQEELDRITSALNATMQLTGAVNAQTATLNKTIEILQEFIDTPHRVTEKLGTFKSNIESLSSLLLSFGEQPLELDCLYFLSEDQELPKANESFWESFAFNFSKFIGSFINDYSTDNPFADESKELKVWVTTGRDQLQILTTMIKDSFTQETKIPVKLSLVDTGDTLIQATMAGKGPDIALMISPDHVINLSARGVLVDLAKPEFNVELEMKDWFQEAAWTRFRYNNGVYAVPETLSFPMLFYRTDIFSELNISPPDTWDEFYSVLQKLQYNNMNVSIPESSTTAVGVSGSIGLFQSFLLQKGGDYYNESLTATLFDTPEAYESFEDWAKLYAEFGVARSVDFFSRFRTGDVPLGLSDYTTYNQLVAAAPELNGLWAMAPYPGTKREDGTIDRTVPASGTGAVILADSTSKRDVTSEAFAFLKWWASPTSQLRYGKELEATLGVAARYAPASVEAFENIGWTSDELQLLQQQSKSLKNVLPVPGDYMLVRSLTNALRATLDDGETPRRALSMYNRQINKEIQRKRKEFKLD